MVASRLGDSAHARAEESPLRTRMVEHLGCDAAEMPVVHEFVGVSAQVIATITTVPASWGAGVTK